ncbi:MAG: glycosyl transferase [Thaumarchaeota archaeon]|nr:MAG: glycosyl transferase [Nitrososphaerota archaeon]
MPAFNEGEKIQEIINKIKIISDEIIVCNDGSTDSTGSIAQKMGAIVINHEKNLGYGAAINSIFSKAREMEADILVTFDADGQHKSNDIKSVIQPIIDRKADIVIGSRFLENELDMPKYRKFGIKTITSLTNISSEIKLTDSQSGFRAYNKKTLSEIHPIEKGMGISTEILIKANKKKLRIKEVPIKVSYQGNTSTHNPISHGISVILSTTKFISIERPLTFYGIPGLIFLIIGLIFVGWTIQYFTEFGVFQPVLALLAIGLTLFGLMCVLTSIILFSLIHVIREQKD